MGRVRQQFGCLLAFGMIGIWSMPAEGGVQEVTGTATAEVRQLTGNGVSQSDFAQETVPSTTGTPPAVAVANLKEPATDGGVLGAARSLAVLEDGVTRISLIPNDAGLDVGGFSGIHGSAWFTQGSVVQKRSILFTAAELGSGVTAGDRVQFRGRVSISGALILTALDEHKDLTGARVELEVSVNQSGASEGLTGAKLEGQVTLTGEGNGAVSLVGNGAFQPTFLPLLDFGGLIPGLVLTKVVVLPALQLSYDYDVVADEPFDLELRVLGTAITVPDGVAAAVVLGLPQDTVPTIFQRVKEGDDRGSQLAALISEKVDTTGQAQPSAGFPLLSGLFQMCGVLGFESLWACGVGLVMLKGVRGRRGRRSLPRSRNAATMEGARR